jgi:hypothetical protein
MNRNQLMLNQPLRERPLPIENEDSRAGTLSLVFFI